MPGQEPEVLTPDGAGAAGAGAEPAEPFLKIDDNTSFNTREEAIKAFSEGTMRHSDYKKRMGEYEANSKKFENDRAEHNRRVQEWDAGKDKRAMYDQLDQIMRTNPAAYKAMMQIVQGTPKGADLEKAIDNILETKGVTKKLEEMEQQEKIRKAREEFDGHVATLSKKYPNFNKDSVLADYENLMHSPEANMGTLIELLHFAGLGRNVKPEGAIKEELLDGLEKKKAAALPGGKGAPPTEKKKHETVEEVRARLKAKLGEG